jgi:L,D-transpeptidase catalytic domain
MSAIRRHASDAEAWPTADERASRRPLHGWRGLLPGVRLGPPSGRPAGRLAVTALAAAAVAVTGIAAAVAASPGARPSGGVLSGARLTGAVGPNVAGSSPRKDWAYAAPVLIGHAVVANPSAGSAPLVLTAEDREDCPVAAAACVDLARHITWLQAGGRVSFGPVRMEPGRPGSAHTTPRGTFQVSWKAGPSFVSDIYDEPMPWATFFAPGGIAFHGGSLTQWSHGCVHLTVANAHYYNEHLPIGAEVVVF